MPAHSLSLILVNYNTRQLLLECLQSIIETTAATPVEIWVADNASTDGSVAAVRASFPGVKIIANESNLGFARANNQYIPVASGDILVLMNPDTVVLPGAIAALEQAFDADATIGVVGSQLLNPDGSIQPSCGNFASIWTEFLFQSFLFKLIPSPFPLGRVIHPLQRQRHKNTHEVDWVTGACLAIRKEVVNRIGLLDEGYFMYGEDMEWCWRATQAGYKVIYQPKAQVIHYSRQASRKDYRAWIVRYTRGHLRFFDKTRTKKSKSLLGLLIFLGSVTRIILWSVICLFFTSRREEARQRCAGYSEAAILGWQATTRKSL